MTRRRREFGPMHGRMDQLGPDFSLTNHSANDWPAWSLPMSSLQCLHVVASACSKLQSSRRGWNRLKNNCLTTNRAIGAAATSQDSCVKWFLKKVQRFDLPSTQLFKRRSTTLENPKKPTELQICLHTKAKCQDNPKCIIMNLDVCSVPHFIAILISKRPGADLKTFIYR